MGDEHRVRLWLGGHSVHLIGPMTHRGYHLWRRPLHRTLNSQQFDGLKELVRIVNVLRTYVSDNNATPRSIDDEAFRLQLADCLTNRNAAAPQFFGELVDVNPDSGWKRAQDDPLTDLVEHELAKRPMTVRRLRGYSRPAGRRLVMAHHLQNPLAGDSHVTSCKSLRVYLQPSGRRAPLRATARFPASLIKLAWRQSYGAVGHGGIGGSQLREESGVADCSERS